MQYKIIMNSIQIIKYNIIQKITQIEDLEVLQKIQDILVKSVNLNDEDINSIPSLLNHKSIDFNDKEDFTDYIKEWLKDM